MWEHWAGFNLQLTGKMLKRLNHGSSYIKSRYDLVRSASLMAMFMSVTLFSWSQSIWKLKQKWTDLGSHFQGFWSMVTWTMERRMMQHRHSLHWQERNTGRIQGQEIPSKTMFQVNNSLNNPLSSRSTPNLKNQSSYEFINRLIH